MARNKRIAPRKAAYRAQFDVLESRDCPGQTVSGLAPFAAGPETVVFESDQSAANASDSGAAATEVTDDVTDTSQLRIWPAEDAASAGAGSSSVAEVARLRSSSSSDYLDSDPTPTPVGNGTLGTAFAIQFSGFGSQSGVGDGGGSGSSVGRTFLSVPPPGATDSTWLAAMFAEAQALASGGTPSVVNPARWNSGRGGSPNGSREGVFSANGSGNDHRHHFWNSVDPLWVLDANNAIVVSPAVADNQFANTAVDLRAQVSGSTVLSYNWDLSQAHDVTNVSGANTYRLQFNWTNFTGAARTNVITLTVTTTGGQMSQTLTFNVTASDSPAWSAAPTTASTWGNVLAPDQVGGNAAVEDGPNYQLGLVDGSVLTSHSLPSYNPGVPGLQLLYSSTAADTKPIFIDHYQLDPGQPVPSRVSAQLTFNGVASPTVWYDTSLLNPGDILQVALQGNATGLPTGRYNYAIAITAHYDTPVTTTNSGAISILDPSNSLFGDGWSLDDYYRLWPVAGGAILEVPGGLSLWFANGQQAGTFVSPAGDFSTLVQNQDATYTRVSLSKILATFSQ